jgi:hypothetical protein
MGREVRKVPGDWHHPKDSNGYLVPLRDGGHDAFSEADTEWDCAWEAWQRGITHDLEGNAEKVDPRCQGMTYTMYAGARPNPDDYMPSWPESERTHVQMYETTTEGTPISPAFETPEALARWLADNGASAFGTQKASYEAWLATCKYGHATSMVLDGKDLHSGVGYPGEKP